MSQLSLDSLAETTKTELGILGRAEEPMPTGDKRTDINELGLELVELECALDIAQSDKKGFADTVAAAARSMDGELLFCLPASGLADGQQKIAAVRIPVAGSHRLVFVFLSEDGARLTVRVPTEETAGLASFSNAFIDLLERL